MNDRDAELLEVGGHEHPTRSSDTRPSTASVSGGQNPAGLAIFMRPFPIVQYTLSASSTIAQGLTWLEATDTRHHRVDAPIALGNLRSTVPLPRIPLP